MDENLDLQAHVTRGVEKIVAASLKATLKDPRESAFMVRFAAASKLASKRRAEAEKAGEHVPPFLIASITSSCNLHCAGCYSRCKSRHRGCRAGVPALRCGMAHHLPGGG